MKRFTCGKTGQMVTPRLVADTGRFAHYICPGCGEKWVVDKQKKERHPHVIEVRD